MRDLIFILASVVVAVAVFVAATRGLPALRAAGGYSAGGRTTR